MKIVCQVAVAPGDVALHHRLRHAVFVEEQAIFATTDTDEHDAEASSLKVLARTAGGEAAGAVRLHPLGGGLWRGDRLAVLPPFRAYAGRPLVLCALALAGAAGGTEMEAWVQPANTRFFLRLGWQPAGPPRLHHGRDHQRMTAALGGALRPPPAVVTARGAGSR